MSEQPKVDFYVMHTDSLAARKEFVARLLGKLQKLGNTAHVAVESAAEAEQLDVLLWSFPPESFLPHGIDKGSGCDEAFVISSESPISGVDRDVFINLRSQPPACHARLKRLVEVVVQDEAILAATRQNFRFYRDQGYPVESHDIRA